MNTATNRSTNTALWHPSDDLIAQSNLTALLTFMQGRGHEVADFEALHTLSVTDQGAFYDAFWDFADVRGDKGARAFVSGDHMMDARYFPDGALSYAENLLFPVNEGAGPALLLNRERGAAGCLSWAELRTLVARYQALMMSAGVTVGDRVAAMVPNGADAIAILLAANGLGAITATASPDFGLEGALDRFGQIEPKVFISANGYIYAGKRHDIGEKTRALAQQLQGLKQHFEFDFLDNDGDGGAGVGARDLPAAGQGDLRLLRLPFDHPLSILFSSGTTGKPKCIVHRQGGVLFKHLIEHIIHCDAKPGDRTFFFTTCGWMMWNWLVTGLANGQTLQLYDGSPFHPRPKVLWELVQDNRLTFFGCGAKYIDSMTKSKYIPRKRADLGSLRTLATTGSPLIHESFDYIYTQVKPDVCVSSISGGTDIVGCFVGGLPTRPVYRGEIQAPILGMDVRVFDDTAQQVGANVQGELVCAAPFTSMPLQFWNDPQDAKYRKAYFEHFAGIWHHGDFMEVTDQAGYVIHGRSDATLNPGGVRIGTAEIYRQVETLPEIAEAVVVGQPHRGDVRVLLFVKLAEGASLDEALIQEIKARIRDRASPRHVPAIIAPVADIPKTRSGKISELAVRDVICGITIKNAGALANPEALDLFTPALEAELNRV